MNPYIGLQEYMSWEACGIDKGRFTDLVDFCHEFMTKKLVTSKTIEGFSFDMTYLEKNISKAKMDGIESSIAWFIENGYVVG